MLNNYRVLDLTDEMGWLTGKLLRDLGADVIKIEPPGGEPGRKLAPLTNRNGSIISLYHLAFNAGKRGITLNLESPSGRELLRNLIKKTDFLIESFAPGHLEKLGLGFNEISVINPALINVSITLFGDDGPYAGFNSSDIVSWALGGQMYLWGDSDRAPVRIGRHSHAFMHAAGQAATGAMLALYERGISGQGRRVSVSVHESVSYMTHRMITGWETQRQINKRGGSISDKRKQRDIGLSQLMVWECKDGIVIWSWGIGISATRANQAFCSWLEESGLADEQISSINWEKLDLSKITPDLLEHVEKITASSFLKHTRSELFEGAVKRRLQIYPIAHAQDVLDNQQLKARDFWVNLGHPALGGNGVVLPGSFLSAPLVMRSGTVNVPEPGEHNREIFCGELGLSEAELQDLVSRGVI